MVNRKDRFVNDLKDGKISLKRNAPKPIIVEINIPKIRVFINTSLFNWSSLRIAYVNPRFAREDRVYAILKDVVA